MKSGLGRSPAAWTWMFEGVRRTEELEELGIQVVTGKDHDRTLSEHHRVDSSY